MTLPAEPVAFVCATLPSRERLLRYRGSSGVIYAAQTAILGRSGSILVRGQGRLGPSK